MPRFHSRLLLFLSALWLTGSLQAQVLGAGRAIPEGFRFELYGGAGSMENLEGSVEERGDFGLLSGGLSGDLQEMGLADDTSSWFMGLRAYNRWVTFLLDYRSTSLDAAGTADQDIRLQVDDVSFGGVALDYLLIPVGTDYKIGAESNWLGLGVRVTPFSLNPEGRVRFTPWVHLGLQVIQAEYEIDAGASASLESVGFPSRIYSVRGQASGKETAAIPEYGLGGELRILLGDEGGAELVGQMTYKLLDFQGAIDSLGMDAAEFQDIDFQYTALEANVFLVYPLNPGLDLLAGAYLEQVDMNAVLDSEDGLGDYVRDVDLSYTLIGLRAGLRF